MTMILDPEAERLASDIAKKTGQPVADVLKAALTAHALATGVLPSSTTGSEGRFNAMLAIAKRAAQRPVFDGRSPDEIIGCNALGLPG
ncbi:MAG TPA: type II toxin-antitoxin system VapB family antitoxin [Stellaceae bacterium]|nr:type II toxin-antitoxin system VapB family antitoxin [Stellaceae bacterium]